MNTKSIFLAKKIVAAAALLLVTLSEHGDVVSSATAALLMRGLHYFTCGNDAQSRMPR